MVPPSPLEQGKSIVDHDDTPSPRPTVGIVIEPATVVDLPELVAVSQAAFVADGWSAENLASELALDFSHCLVARAGAVVGYLVFWCVLDEVHILQVATAPPWRGRGIASALVARTLEDGQALGGRSFLLEVRVSNLAARRLYERHGFGAIALRRRYYEHPVEDAVVMARYLG